MQRFLASIALVIGSGLCSSQAVALGFGKVEGATTLGHPLNFRVALRLDPSESIDASCVKVDVASGDRQLPAPLIRHRLDGVRGSADRLLRISTSTPIDEPVVTVNLTVGCPPSLERSYVVFADPPQGAVVAGNDPAWEDEPAESPLSAVASAVPRTSRASSGSGEAASTSRGTRPERVAKAKAGEAASSGPGQASASVRKNSDPVARVAKAASVAARPRTGAAPVERGSVLKLDPIEAESLVSPPLQMATSLAQLPDASASAPPSHFIDPELEKRVREQERVRAIEASMVGLRKDQQTTQKTLVDLKRQLQDAEAGRYANPLVYALMALCAVLAVAAAAMFWLRHRERQAGTWWVPPEEPDAGAPSASLPSELPMVTAPAMRVEPIAHALPDAALPDLQASDLVVSPAPAPPVAQTERLTAELDIVSAQPHRPMSADELIDLEQQADFFVVLGQDDAAVDLLMGHVRSTGGVSPLPYLKLLEIYRRRGEQDPYDRIRERFNRRFNAYAPEWGLDPESGLGLDGYPEVNQRIQNAWNDPSEAMGLLDAALFRRDAGPTFDVPAYRELLFLYGIARDLAEREAVQQGVDLLLPLDLSPPAAAAPHAVPAPVAVIQTDGDDAHFSLEFDMSDEPEPLLTLENPDADFKLKTH